MLDRSNLPKHIAIIMDGNGRWARKRHLPKTAGHRQGMESLRQVVQYCCNIGIPILTVYAFSTENWKRPKKEIETLMGFVKEYIDREIEEFKRNKIRVNFIGRLEELPSSIRDKIEWAIKETKDYSRLIFNVALNYGSRREIVDAVNEVIKNRLDKVDERIFSQFLYTRGLPDPDLLIRTSGEMRISNFLLWQISYTEFYFTPTLWPDFGKTELEKALRIYQNRERRFGG